MDQEYDSLFLKGWRHNNEPIQSIQQKPLNEHTIWEEVYIAQEKIKEQKTPFNNLYNNIYLRVNNVLKFLKTSKRKDAIETYDHIRTILRDLNKIRMKSESIQDNVEEISVPAELIQRVVKVISDNKNEEIKEDVMVTITFDKKEQYITPDCVYDKEFGLTFMVNGNKDKWSDYLSRMHEKSILFDNTRDMIF